MMGRDPDIRHRRSHFFQAAPGPGWQILRAADEVWGPTRTVDRPQFAACFFALVLGGRARLLTDGQAGELLPGRVFAMLPQHDHRLHVQQDLHMRILVGHGDGLAVAAHDIATGPPCIWEPPRPITIDTILQEALVVAEESGPTADTVGRRCLELLLALLAHAPCRPPSDGAAATFAACRETMARHALAMNGVADAAELCGLDRAYLARLFKRHGGESPSDFLLRHKMQHAAEQLATGSSVADCAAACGYRNVDVFSRAFRRHFGQNPSRWRGQMA